MSRRRTVVVALVFSLSLLAAGCADDKGTTTKPSSAAPKSAVTVNIASFKFVLESVTLAAGGTVTWVNRDKAPHTAQNTGEEGPAEFDTGRLNLDQRKGIRLEKPGVYQYYCIYHRFMRASVTVVK